MIPILCFHLINLIVIFFVRPMRCMPLYLNPSSVVYFSVDSRPGIEVVVVLGRNLPDFPPLSLHALPFVCSDTLPLPSIMKTCGRPCVGLIPHIGPCRVDAQTQVEPLDLRVRRGRRTASAAQLPQLLMPTQVRPVVAQAPTQLMQPPPIRTNMYSLSSGVPYFIGIFSNPRCTCCT